MTVKANLSLAAILSATAITGGVLLAAANPTQAFGCPFSKSKGTSVETSGAPSGPVAKKFDPTKLGIAAAGMASVAGLFAAGMAYKARRTGKLQPVTGDVAPEDALQDSPAIAISQDALSAPTSKDASPTGDRALTLVS